MQAWLQPTQARMSSTAPRAALAGIAGSQIMARVMPHMSACPSASAAYVPSKRDAVWLREYRAHKGQIGLDFARKLLSTPEIVSAFGVDAKYTDARCGRPRPRRRAITR